MPESRDSWLLWTLRAHRKADLLADLSRAASCHARRHLLRDAVLTWRYYAEARRGRPAAVQKLPTPPSLFAASRREQVRNNTRST